VVQLITSGELGPGEPIRQNQLAERIGISPTPVREALRRLEAQGLVVLEPHRGVRVIEVEPHEMSELYEIRAALEGLAVERAVPLMTEKQIRVVKNAQSRLEEAWSIPESKLLGKYNYEFHTGIYRLSRRPRLIRMIDSLWPLFPWDSMSTIPGRGPGIVEEHRAILAAVIDRDAARAHQAMRFHMEAGARALVAYHGSRAPQKVNRGRRPANRRSSGSRRPADSSATEAMPQ
jgi:DNA-binding GntR family transcriptional regulator